jgi:hypothetical protein
VYLAPAEAEPIALGLKIDAYEFADKFCELQDRQRLVLKKNQDESCVFLTRDGCGIYKVRPTQCRDFPLKWKTERSIQYCEGIKAYRKQTDD